jgi:protein-disulfide isomerase
MNRVTTFAASGIFVLLAGHFAPLSVTAAAAGQIDSYLGGTPSSAVKIEVFSDYQCAACRALYLQTVRPLLRDYSGDDRVSLIYHDYPLPSHRYSREATRYALAARRLGQRFWLQLTDALYVEQAVWSENGRLDIVASRLFGPQVSEQITKLLQDSAIEKEVEREMELARSREIQATPTLFVTANGRTQRITGNISYAVLKSYLERNLR